MSQTLHLAVVVLALVGAGAALAFQAPVNNVLARSVGGLMPAATISVGLTFLGLAIIMVISGQLPRFGSFGQAPWWAWMGFITGVVFMVSTMWAVPKVGALSMLVAAILGQLLAGLLLDRFGAFGLAVQEITWPRLAGVALVLTGLVMTRL